MKKTMQKLKVMNIRLNSVRSKLMRVRSSLETSLEIPNPNLRCKQFLQLQLKTIENAFADYNKLHQRVFEADVGDEVREDAEVEYVTFEQQYGELFIYISKLIDDNIKTEEDAARTAAAVHPLPSILNTTEIAPHLPPLKVPLPTFDGTYENWFAFRSMFETIMKRYSTESPAIKLYHLRNSLVGKAAGIIDQEIINNNDYDMAWKMLIERFEDKRLIIDKHIDALFNLSKLVNENATELRKFIDTCAKNVDALKNLGLPVEGLGECMLINRIASKLDIETRKAWELNHVDDTLPGYDDTLEFLRERCKVLEKIQPDLKQTMKSQRPVRSAQDVKGKTSTLVATSNKCPQCSDGHELWRCDTFKNGNLSEKYNLLRRIGACFNCLQKGHRTNNCTSKHTCKKCRKFHHTMLHPEEDSAKKSETSLISAINPEPLKENSEQPIKGGSVVTSRVNDYTICLELLVVPKITGVLPTTKVNVTTLAFPNGIDLADPGFYIPDKVNMLLGADVFFDMLMAGRIQLPNSAALLQETQFGWVLSGLVPTEASGVVHSFCATAPNENLDVLVRRFWELESFGDIELPCSISEEECLRHFETTHERTAEGRYLVHLPFNDKKKHLGESRSMAEKRFLGLERRLDKASELKILYKEFLKDYEALGHMVENPNPDDLQAFYLPHHYVLKPTSTTTKLRVVSINQTQMIGPTVQNDLVLILLNFRSHRFALVADIPKMYRQVAVYQDDCRYQRILWRENRNEPLKTYDLQTVTYGLASFHPRF
ncbi:uncharacterized protein LOC131680205 [Topomyia yanbarensis]|uniref:uncharacterized protein LOC131680203 n=1 Tax=Topomyia yanbarensis TaxID=2498891 RepID=UPI00273B1BE5|nr:uncharacterized protein LOC131680203 [Topomyia yanbarensis]XP_058816908.1 uncharacterized protein LOC131680205 [Topomyia yanbarensis]